MPQKNKENFHQPSKKTEKKETRRKEKGKLEEFTGQPTYTCLGALQIKGLAYFQSMKFIRLSSLVFWLKYLSSTVPGIYWEKKLKILFRSDPFACYILR